MNQNDDVQSWESDEKKVSLDKAGAPKCGKRGLIQKLGLALGLKLGLAFMVWKSPLLMNQMVSKVGKVPKKVLSTKLGPQSVEKVDFFSKVTVRLEFGLAFQGVKIFTFDGSARGSVHNWESDEKSAFKLDKIGVPSVERKDFLKVRLKKN